MPQPALPRAAADTTRVAEPFGASGAVASPPSAAPAAPAAPAVPAQASPATPLADTVAAVRDSLADTSNAIQKAAKDVGEASELLLTGRWELFAARVFDSTVRMVAEFVPNLVKATVVFLLLFGAYKLVRSVLRRIVLSSDHLDEGLRNLLLRSYRIFAVILIVVMVLAQFGIDITVLVGGLSIAGLALGFAAKDTLENFISGIAIMLDRPFRVGDQVEVGGTYGTVVDISLRSTRLRTPHNQIMVMPNLMMVNQKVINHAMLGAVRVRIPFSIAYHESPAHARAVLLPLVEGDASIAQEPPPHVVVMALSASSVDMELRFFLIDPSLEVPITSEYLEGVHATLRQAGIEIPFPQLDVTLKTPAPPPPKAPLVLPDSDDMGEPAEPLLDVEGAAPHPDAATLAARVEEQQHAADPDA